jgi:DNA polymerase-1
MSVAARRGTQTLRMTWADDLRAQGLGPAARWRSWPASARWASRGPGGSTRSPAGLVEVVTGLTPLEPRWTWWSARETAPGARRGRRARAHLLGPRRGRPPGAGLRRDDPAAVWAAAHGLPEPARLSPGGSDLLDLDAPDGAPLRPDGQLSREWLRGAWAEDPQPWAELALRAQAAQEAVLRAVPDPRPRPGAVPLAVLTAWSESAAALLAVELEHAACRSTARSSRRC